MSDFIVSLVTASLFLAPIVALCGLARLAGFGDRGDTRRLLSVCAVFVVAFAIWT